jgi:hypothetical protein
VSYIDGCILAILGGVASAARPIQQYYTTRGAEVPAAGLEVNITNAGMVIWVTGASYAISCERGSGTGTVEQRGKATSTMTYEECVIREARKPGASWELGKVETACKVKSRGQAEGKIALGTIKSELVWAEGANVFLNLVEPSGASFAEIEISTGAGERCEPGGANRTGSFTLAGSYLPVWATSNGEAPFLNEEISSNLTLNPPTPFYTRWEVEPRAGGGVRRGAAALTLGGAAVAIEQRDTIRPKPKLNECPNMGVHE